MHKYIHIHIHTYIYVYMIMYINYNTLQLIYTMARKKLHIDYFTMHISTKVVMYECHHFFPFVHITYIDIIFCICTIIYK